MAINKYLRFWERPTSQEVTLLLSEVSALRQLHQHNIDTLGALHNRIDEVVMHLGDVAQTHLGVSNDMRDNLGRRIGLVSDTVLATLGEVMQLRAFQGSEGASSGEAISSIPVADDDDALALPPRDRHAMLVLSDFFQHSVQ